ncbi:MAG: winged helix-turn-helix domain-containing protein [Bacteroidales bacterium]
MSTFLCFDRFEVDVAAGHLFKGGARIHLREQSFQVLALLLERPGEVVSRDDLRRRLWSGEVFVDFENNLNAVVARLREALGDSAERPRFIETLPKRGYRFIGTISAPVARTKATVLPAARLLVLPFVNLTGDAAQEYVADAITDEVITALAALAPHALAVIARTTAMRYKRPQKDLARIGRELNLDYIVEGAVRRAGECITVSVQLIRASDQAHVWAKRYDPPPGDIFSIPDSVTQAIADALDVNGRSARGTVGQAGARQRTTRDPVAYLEYVQGRRDLDRMSPILTGFKEGRAHLEEAVARDPGFGLAHEALAQMYWFLGYTGVMAPRDAFSAGVLHAVRSVEIDSTRAEPRALVAQYHKQLDYAWPDIERELAAALELNPASSLVRMLYAVSWLMPQGRLDEAIAELERALEWDPLSYQVHFWHTIMLSLAREPDRVVEQSRLLIELEPGSSAGPWLLGVGLSRKGLFEEASAALQRAVELSDGSALMLGWFGLVLGISGRGNEAQGVLERLEAMARTRYVPPSSFAWVYLGLRDVDRAFGWLERAVDARDQLMMPIKSYVFFDPIRADPRFSTLLHKMKLDE